MERDTSKEILDMVRRISGELHASIRVVIDASSELESSRYKRVIGGILADVYDEIMTPIMDEYPELVPDTLRSDRD